MSRINLNAIVVQGDAATLVAEAEELGKQLVQQRLSTSQIRNIFGTVRRIEMNWPERPQDEAERQRVTKSQRELLLLKPKMAYQAKRERGRGVGMLTDVLSEAIDLVGKDRTKFQHFVDFFEAILAYHKAHGGN
ncbi:MAG: type III-A CRISPR-associated protein Csm2 [Chloroflexi bacterium]|nr:MAG: type III-A CRISPR-associated protein Csm2 [Anaerolineaceae bacterium 4572_32.1]RLC79159.1 MAG: type III-A CRISPR-associated protein Csm2 [Chloroflexota bacterium]RLC85025.1 MAG: type III-A CRISPR-associated protein Csm2 [Chloroflexota bacterium]HEY73859.1 type III-A CRISPR-associated protein Csm2 [Thermoflexia bacterium]